jgi:hypothetical protein
MAAFDLETYLSRPGVAAPEIVCGSVANDTGCHLLTPAQALAWFQKQIRDPKAHVVGCNLVYDLGCLCAVDPSLVDPIYEACDSGRLHDVAIREALIDIGKGELVDRGEDGIGIRYGLKLLAQRYLGLDLAAEKKSPDAWRKRYGELAHTPIELWPWAARVYPLRDVAFPLEIYRQQVGGLNLHDEPTQMGAAFALQLMSIWGVRANGATVTKLRARVEAADLAATFEFQKCRIIRVDGTEDKKRLAELVTKAYDGAPPKTKPTKRYPEGQVSSDRDTLAESGSALLESYAKAGKNDKYLNTYIPILDAGVDQPWNPEFNILVATTRVSSNAQQFPQKGGVRECFEARQGKVYCSVDYGGGELRTMAQVAIWDVHFSRMADALIAGQDLHLIAAASFMGGLTYDSVVAMHKSHEPRVKVFRDLGKVFNFGKGGGMGAGAMTYNARNGKNGTTVGPDGRVYEGSRFCLLTDVSKCCGARKVVIKVQGKERRVCAACLDVAKQLDIGWLKAWPEQKARFDLASKLSKAGRWITATIPVSKVVRGKCGYTQYLNTPFQGLLAVATKRAMIRVSREMYCDQASPMFGDRLVLNVHDELIAEMAEHSAPESAERMALIMRESLQEVVPDLAKAVEAEPALCRTMTKSMQTVRDTNGRLMVWEPKQ